MLSKNCLTILKKLNADPEADGGFSLAKIASLSNLSEADTRRAAEHLVQEGYLEHREPYRDVGQSIPEWRLPLYLTEPGTCYKQIKRQQFWAYIADKWIDILASLVSIISLVVSIIAMCRAG